MSAEGVLNGEESIEAMEWFQSALRERLRQSFSGGRRLVLRLEDRSASYVGHWMKQPHLEGLGQENLVLIPIFKGPEEHVTGMGSWNWGITSNAENPEAVWEFMEFLLSPEEILRMTDGNGAIPRGRARSISATSTRTRWLALRLPRAAEHDRRSAASDTRVSHDHQRLPEAVQNVVNGADVQEQLDQAVQEIDQDIEDNNGYPTN